MKLPKPFKIRILHPVLIIFIGSALFSACIEDDIEEPFIGWEESNYEPLIMTRSSLESSIEFKQAKGLVNTGKIYSYGIYILINEKYEGVHVFNNADPRSPQKIGFISVPGCVDMAVKDGIMYVDNAVDLVSIDINSLPQIEITNRVRSIFPELTPPDLTFVPFEYTAQQRPENTVIVKWERK